jgi:hypothetical protein
MAVINSCVHKQNQRYFDDGSAEVEDRTKTMLFFGQEKDDNTGDKGAE